MARWALGWLLFISVATAGSYWWTNERLWSSSSSEVTFAMQPLGELGSPLCKRATRELVAAGDGSADRATSEQRAAWDRAKRDVLTACGSA